MMMEYITLAGLLLAVFETGYTVGKSAERIESFLRRQDNEEHNNTSKNDRR